MNTFTLKMIALVAMVCDHVGLIFFPEWIVFRIIGRISFPIFAYVLVEGFFYTRDIKKYLLRLGLLSLVSEIPFDLMASGRVLEFGHQNVFFTLTLGILALWLMSRTINPILQLIYAGAIMVVSNLLHVDYRQFGVLLIIWFYYWRSTKWVKYLGAAVIMVLLKGWTGVYTIPSLIPMLLYNEKQGPKWKWFFYIFYPVHLLVIWGISLLL